MAVDPVKITGLVGKSVDEAYLSDDNDGSIEFEAKLSDGTNIKIVTDKYKIVFVSAEVRG